MPGNLPAGVPLAIRVAAIVEGRAASEGYQDVLTADALKRIRQIGIDFGRATGATEAARINQRAILLLQSLRANFTSSSFLEPEEIALLDEALTDDGTETTPRPASKPRRPRPQFSARRFLAALAVLVVITLVVVIVALTRQGQTVPLNPSGGSGQSQPLRQPNVTTPQQQMINEYGPFNVVANDADTPPYTGAPAVLYIDDSSADSGLASAHWTVRFVPQAWEQGDSPLITNIQTVASPGQYFTFQTGGSSLIVFTVKAYQPFFLMSLPRTLFVIDAHGQLWHIDALGAQAKHLRIPYTS